MIDHRRPGATMVPVLIHQYGPCSMGRRRDERAALPGTLRPPSAFLSHDAHALHHAHPRSNVLL
jgi:hypothetical protein